MLIQFSQRRLPVLVSVLAAGLMLAAVSCTSHVTPLGPDVSTPQPRHLGAPIILQVMRSHQPEAAGGCPAGWVAAMKPPGAAPMPCYRPIGTPVTITSAAVWPVRPTPRSAASYGMTVVVPAADVSAVTAIIKHAYTTRDALGISVGGKLWEAPQVEQAFPGQQLQIAPFSENQALRLYRMLVPSG